MEKERAELKIANERLESRVSQNPGVIFTILEVEAEILQTWNLRGTLTQVETQGWDSPRFIRCYLYSSTATFILNYFEEKIVIVLGESQHCYFSSQFELCNWKTLFEGKIGLGESRPRKLWTKGKVHSTKWSLLPYVIISGLLRIISVEFTFPSLLIFLSCLKWWTSL